MEIFESVIQNYEKQLVVGILVFFSIMEIIAGYLSRTQRKGSDWIQEAGGFFVLSLFTKPAIVLFVGYIGTTFFGSYATTFDSWSFWGILLFYLLIDDVMQYWYHRSAHEYEFLWKLHRSHHQAEEMGFFVSYRNAGLYYVLMPNIWWVGLISFLGGAIPVAFGLIIKQLVVIGSHSTIHWDQALYKVKFLNPLMTVIERIFITPAFHHGHHGKSMLDGVSDPNGNYGNMFSFWDQIFGTATFTRQFPKELGLPYEANESWTASYFYPAVKAKDTDNELSKGYKKENTATPEPIKVNLEKGERYLWCQCGKSKTQPFCDGSHHGSKFKPIPFEATRTGKARICNCKITKTGPFCDESHTKLVEK